VNIYKTKKKKSDFWYLCFSPSPSNDEFFKAFYYFALLLKTEKYYVIPSPEIPGVKTLIQICPMPTPALLFFLISAKNHSAPPTLQTKKLHPYYYYYAVIIVFS